ncbi:hypothetical protein BJX63DRAFT_394165 [Aspergillus granulosus]|uniref:Uncharacterized protein n=1 Tax=Aspergillus granulosus TaxID=176169 RepID=A0ABR4HFP1_9EURO
MDHQIRHMLITHVIEHLRLNNPGPITKIKLTGWLLNKARRPLYTLHDYFYIAAARFWCQRHNSQAVISTTETKISKPCYLEILLTHMPKIAI